METKKNAGIIQRKFHLESAGRTSLGRNIARIRRFDKDIYQFWMDHDEKNSTRGV
jgi:hypothetical protein